MRNPVRSEADAFHIVVGSTAILAVAVLLGALLSPLVGVALVAGAILGVLVWEFRSEDPERRRPLHEAHRFGRDTPHDRHRVLVVANRTLTSDALRAELARHAAAGAELRIVAPILASRAHYIASDIDTELADARERVRETLAWAQQSGVAVTGRVGDPNVALGAIEDELRRGGADEVLISTLPEKQSNWLETGIVARLQDELEIPVTHLVVEPVLTPSGG
jgi:GABA permease